MEPREFQPIVEVDPSSRIGIFSETDRLTEAAVWGPVGVEAVLAQLLPFEQSLFYDKMDVIAARQESFGFAQTLTSYGVKIHMVRDQLAQQLKPQSLKKTEIKDQLFARAQVLDDTYGKLTDEHKDAIEFLLEEDISRYGEERALTLNKVLSLDPELPLGNTLYARDQMNIILASRIQCRMAKPIRRREVALYEMIYRDVLELPEPIRIPKGETFEGGDAYVHNGVVYVGVGARTTLGAAKHIFESIHPQLQEYGYEFAIVVDEEANSRSTGEQMDFMHIDTFSAPTGTTQIALCEEEASRRRIKLLNLDDSNRVNIIDTQRSQLEFLSSRGEKILIIPRHEQSTFGANFLAIDEKTILVPIEANGTIIDQLKKLGKNVVYVPLDESTHGYGAAHCMTGQLKRVASIN